MELNQIKSVILSCVQSQTFCRVKFRYEYSEKYLLPLLCGGECFVSAEESDFALDGYVIHALCDVEDVKTAENGFASKALRGGTFEYPIVPPLNPETMADCVASLRTMNTVSLIECSQSSSDMPVFLMGKIVNSGPVGCVLCPLSISGQWSRIPEQIGYGEIRRISFGKKSQELYSKLLPSCPLK